MSPSGTIESPLEHSFSAPAFKRSSVVDAMRMGIVDCAPDTTLREVARIMATYRIHAVVVREPADDRPWGVVAGSDLAAVAGEDVDTVRASEIARTELVTVAANAPLSRAAQLMAEHEVNHLLVVQPHSGQPVGVISVLDLAGVLAWGARA